MPCCSSFCRSFTALWKTRCIRLPVTAALVLGASALASACGSSRHAQAYVPAVTFEAGTLHYGLRYQPERLIVAGDGSEIVTHFRHRKYGSRLAESRGRFLVD